jgi:hypothetical protein
MVASAPLSLIFSSLSHPRPEEPCFPVPLLLRLGLLLVPLGFLASQLGWVCPKWGGSRGPFTTSCRSKCLSLIWPPPPSNPLLHLSRSVDPFVRTPRFRIMLSQIRIGP